MVRDASSFQERLRRLIDKFERSDNITPEDIELILQQEAQRVREGMDDAASEDTKDKWQ